MMSGRSIDARKLDAMIHEERQTNFDALLDQTDSQP